MNATPTPDNLSPQIIAVSSGKGGVGKTTFSVNLGIALARQNKNVLLVDGDLGLANVDVALGLNVRHTLQETIEDGRNLSAVVVEVFPHFHVLPASSGVPEMASLAYEDQAYLLNALEEIGNQFDYIIVDTAAGIGDAVLWFNNWAHTNIVILSPDPTSMTDAYALIKVLVTRYSKKSFYLVVNNVKSIKEGQGVFANINAVLNRFLKITPFYLGAIPQDSNVVQAIRTQTPLLVSARESKAGDRKAWRIRRGPRPIS